MNSDELKMNKSGKIAWKGYVPPNKAVKTVTENNSKVDEPSEVGESYKFHPLKGLHSYEKQKSSKNNNLPISCRHWRRCSTTPP